MADELDIRERAEKLAADRLDEIAEFFDDSTNSINDRLAAFRQLTDLCGLKNVPAPAPEYGGPAFTLIIHGKEARQAVKEVGLFPEIPEYDGETEEPG